MRSFLPNDSHQFFVVVVSRLEQIKTKKVLITLIMTVFFWSKTLASFGLNIFSFFSLFSSYIIFGGREIDNLNKKGYQTGFFQ